ncbi:Serine/threonine protein kinase, partial [Phytophthora megakarya]
FLEKEIDSHGSSYKPDQLKLLQKAYSDLNAHLKSDAVTTMPKWFLPWYELEFDGAKYLAEGGFGEVYRAKWLESEVVVKQVKLSNFNNSNSGAFHGLSASLPRETRNTKQNDKDTRKMFDHEVEVWFGLSHPHVVRLFGACHVGTPLFACEYASNGSLDKYLRKHPNEIWQKLYEAALGVQYLHSLIHGDLKCNNIVVGGDNKAKITDFGLSSANVVTGAWHWVAPECSGKEGSSKLSTASDIYAFGMCIVEALRIVEIITTKKEGCVYPWGNLDNTVVKYHVKRSKKLPNRPKHCTDHVWRLVERMCAFDRSKRIKISTVVSELGALAGVDTSQTPEMAEAESVKISKEEVDKMKSCCDFKAQDQRKGSSSNQFVLCSVYGLLWDRFQDICSLTNGDFANLQPLFECARTSTRKLEQCPNTLTGFTEMAMNGYALHREFDKVIDANFWCVNATDGELHDWKSKCKTIICNLGLASPPQENNEQSE